MDCYYYLVDIDIKSGKQAEFHDYWANICIPERLANGSEHIGTFSVIAGSDAPTHVKSLFKINNFTGWVDSESCQYHSEKWTSLCDSVKVSLMASEPYSEWKRFLHEGTGEKENYYFFADIELKANRQKEYHEFWPNHGIPKHRSDGAEHVGTFTMISGTESTVHVKRLFRVTDLEAWVKGETHNYHSDYWEYLAIDVTTTLVVPQDYSPIR